MIKFIKIIRIFLYTKIIIIKSKKLAFQRFYNQIKFEKASPNLSLYFNISQNLIEKSESLRNIPIKKLDKEQKLIYREVENTFNNLWKDYKKDIIKIYNLLCEEELKKWIWLKEAISKTTKNEWPYSSIIIFPGISDWGKSKANLVCMGIKPEELLQKIDYPLLIHELTHVNTSKIKIKLKNDLHYKKDSDEITVTIITREITRQLNNKFNLDLPPQRLAVPFKHLEPHDNELNNLFQKTLSYKELIFKVDNFLYKIHHKEHYKSFI